MRKSKAIQGVNLVNGYDKSALDAMRRAIRGMNKAKLAAQCDISRTVIYDFLNGSVPTLENLNKIAAALGMTPPRLVELSADRSLQSSEAPAVFAQHVGSKIQVPDKMTATENECRLILAMRESDSPSMAIQAALELLLNAQSMTPDSAVVQRQALQAAIGILSPFGG